MRGEKRELSPEAREAKRAYEKAYKQRPGAKEAHRLAQDRYWERKAKAMAEAATAAATEERPEPSLFTVSMTEDLLPVYRYNNL